MAADIRGVTESRCETSIIVVATDEMHHLRTCLPSLGALQGIAAEVIVVDNASRDDTAEALPAEFPWVRVVRTDRRLGYAGANNLGFATATGRYLVVLNPDTRVDPNFASELVAASRANHDRSLITSLVCMFDDPGVVNTCGNIVQFALLASCRGIGMPASTFKTEEDVPAISGCAFLIPRDLLNEFGGFDESTYLYLEDTELSLRARLYGFSCKTCPSSVVYHKYGLRMTARKFGLIERNRWIVMLRTYRLRTLALLAPALALIECFSWGYAVQTSRVHMMSKARSYVELVRLGPSIIRSRAETQQMRKVPDRALLNALQGALPVDRLAEGGKLTNGTLRGVNVFLSIYLRTVRSIVRW